MNLKTVLSLPMLLLLTWAMIFFASCDCGDDDAGGDDDDSGGNDDEDDSAPDDDAIDDDSVNDDDTSSDDTSDDDTSDDDDTVVHGFEGWVVGWAGFDEGAIDAVVYHDDHGTWASEALPDFGQNSRLNSVSMTGPEDGWAIGSLGHYYNGTALVIHYNGGSWEQVNVPEITCGPLIKVEFLDQDHGMVLCYNTLQNGLFYTYDTGTWFAGTIPVVAQADGFVLTMAGLSLVAADHAYASGSINFGGGSSILLDIQNDQADFLIWGPEHDFNFFEGIRVKDGADGYLAENFLFTGSSATFYHYDGAAWSPASQGYILNCISAFDRSPGGTWFASTYGFNQGTVYRKLGPIWISMTAPPSHYTEATISLRDIQFPDDSYAVAVGEDWKWDLTVGEGYAIRYDGADWHRINSLRGAEETYRGVSYVPSPRR